MTHIRQFGGNVTPTVFDQFCGAGGLALIVGTLIKQETQIETKDEELSGAVAVLIYRVVFAPLFTLLIGWVVKSFI